MDAIYYSMHNYKMIYHICIIIPTCVIVHGNNLSWYHMHACVVHTFNCVCVMCETVCFTHLWLSWVSWSVFHTFVSCTVRTFMFASCVFHKLVFVHVMCVSHIGVSIICTVHTWGCVWPQEDRYCMAVMELPENDRITLTRRPLGGILSTIYSTFALYVPSSI